MAAAAFAFSFFLACIGVILFSSVTRPRLVVGTSWSFSYDIEEKVRATREGWDLPSDGSLIEVISKEQRIKHLRTAVDHYETQCVDVTVDRWHDNWTTVCATKLTGWTEPLEIYSHTEDVCYADGRCEEKDVYVKQPAEPIHKEECHQVNSPWKSVEVEQRCKQVPITIDVIERGDFYTYAAYVWQFKDKVEKRGVNLPLDLKLPLEPPLPESPLVRHTHAAWHYYLHLDNGKREAVTREVFVQAQIGQAYEKN